jgi:SAM-dependent methyltransferase
LIRRFFAVLRRRSRERRYRQLSHSVHIESLAGPLLDLGGGPASFFSSLFPRPSQVILIDVDPSLAQHAKQIQPGLFVITADGERLPLADQSITCTVCNSVIEHVNDPAALAAEISRVSRNFFIQTPNGRFPLETHSFIAIPFYNLIPGNRLRRLVCTLFGANFEYVNSVRYLSEQRLRMLFPDTRFIYERVLGTKKSFYIYRRSGDPK